MTKLIDLLRLDLQESGSVSILKKDSTLSKMSRITRIKKPKKVKAI